MGSHTAPRPRVSVGLLLFAIVLLSANLRAPIVAVGPVVGFIREDLGVSGAFIGAVAALPVLAFAVFSPLAARLARRFGIENVLVGSLVLLLAGVAVRSALPSAPLLAVGTLMLSAAIAMGNVLLPALAKRSLPARIGLAVGMMSATMSLSAALSAALAVPLAQWRNWQWSLGVWALAAMAALLVWLLVGARSRTGADWGAAAVSDGLNVWRSRAAWVISVFMGMQSLMFYAVVNFLPSVLVEKGVAPAAAGNYMSLFQMVSVAGILAVSLWFGRSGGRQALNLAFALLLLAGVAGVWLGTPAQMWLWVAAAGIGASASFTAAMMLFALRTDNSSQAAALSGMAQAVGYAIAVAGPLGMGVLFDISGSWSVPMAVLAALMLPVCVLAWFAAAPETLSQNAA